MIQLIFTMQIVMWAAHIYNLHNRCKFFKIDVDVLYDQLKGIMTM